jgi:hypothetical protein
MTSNTSGNTEDDYEGVIVPPPRHQNQAIEQEEARQQQQQQQQQEKENRARVKESEEGDSNDDDDDDDEWMDYYRDGQKKEKLIAQESEDDEDDEDEDDDDAWMNCLFGHGGDGGGGDQQWSSPEKLARNIFERFESENQDRQIFLKTVVQELVNLTSKNTNPPCSDEEDNDKDNRRWPTAGGTATAASIDEEEKGECAPRPSCHDTPFSGTPDLEDTPQLGMMETNDEEDNDDSHQQVHHQTKKQRSATTLTSGVNESKWSPVSTSPSSTGKMRKRKRPTSWSAEDDTKLMNEVLRRRERILLQAKSNPHISDCTRRPLGFWKNIAAECFGDSRTSNQCLKRYKHVRSLMPRILINFFAERLFANTQPVSCFSSPPPPQHIRPKLEKTPFTAEENTTIAHAHDQLGNKNNWDLIAKLLPGSKSGQSVMHHFISNLEQQAATQCDDRSMRMHHFISSMQQQYAQAAVRNISYTAEAGAITPREPPGQLGDPQRKKKNISKGLPPGTSSDQSAMDDPSISSMEHADDNEKPRFEYSAKEDFIIRLAHRQLGNKWDEIAERLPGRSPDAVRGRVCRLKKKCLY